MTGKYIVKIHNQRVTYTIELERNITVICGDSGTGKTTLINSISFYEELGKKSGVTIESSKECHVLEGKRWYEELNHIKDSFVFIDEGAEFLNTVEFARAIKGTDNYYVLVTRENLYQLPYSVNSILELKKTTSRFKHVYNKTYPKYDVIDNFEEKLDRFELFLTEDTNAGNEFFSYVADKNGLYCVSAGGKSKILNKLRNNDTSRTIVIADGAAFGSNMAEVYRYVKAHSDKVLLYLPESFEWLILAAEIIGDEEIDNIIQNPYDYIESAKYMSWEQFFTDYLIKNTKGTSMKYSKKKLNKYYLEDKNIEKIINKIQKN